MRTGFRANRTALALTLALAPLPALAQQTFTATGTSGGNPVSAQAAFTFNQGSLSVTLTNMLATNGVISSAQAISDLIFTLSGTAGTLGAGTASGQLGNVSNTGVETNVAGTPTVWTSAGHLFLTGNTVTLEALGGGQPNQMILPTISNGGTYASANAGLQNFNPYVIGPATFTIALSGVTAATRVTTVDFSFGTAPEATIRGTGNTVTPEPATVALLATGLMGLGVAARRRRA